MRRLFLELAILFQGTIPVMNAVQFSAPRKRSARIHVIVTEHTGLVIATTSVAKFTASDTTPVTAALQRETRKDLG
jgi:hypothetical protein